MRVAVVGVGEFGRNHVRVYCDLPDAELVGVVDVNADRAKKVSAEFATQSFSRIEDLVGKVDAVSLAVPTVDHARIGSALLAAGVDVLVEKPIAASQSGARELIGAAQKNRRILQVGHLERFNPAMLAVEKIVNQPLFFEVHRLGVFTARSLDIDVVYDVMIHDLDILLALVNSTVRDLKAVGIPIVTDKVDIAHARIEFESGAVANVTASRVSTERVRKCRFFQAHEYISMDFARRDALRVRVKPGDAARIPAAGLSQWMDDDSGSPQFDFEKLPVQGEEPLRAELREFLDCVRTRRTPRVNGDAGLRALELADSVMAGILNHAQRVQLGALAPQVAR
ncbi:MAG: Gfo/Idh/MocA family oxidoreductase [Acidobacteria bacterium]|nr:Gfo/Idh/MocA family oxidoreductase [Acidobacteriota bacterium]